MYFPVTKLLFLFKRSFYFSTLTGPFSDWLLREGDASDWLKIILYLLVRTTSLYPHAHSTHTVEAREPAEAAISFLHWR